VLAYLPRNAGAQLGLFGGEAVDAETSAPLRKLAVTLIDPRPLVGVSNAAKTKLASTTTDDRGLFELPHISSGVFRLRFDMPGKMPAFGPVDTVSADSVVERRYKLVFIDAQFDSVFLPIQVDSVAEMERNQRAMPRYPSNLEPQGIGGMVILSFVVDTAGRTEMNTVTTILSTHDAFYRSVMSVLPKLRFLAATFQGRKVRQQVEQRFEFRVQ
jgi:TonB family protein